MESSQVPTCIYPLPGGGTISGPIPPIVLLPYLSGNQVIVQNGQTAEQQLFVGSRSEFPGQFLGTVSGTIDGQSVQVTLVEGELSDTVDGTFYSVDCEGSIHTCGFSAQGTLIGQLRLLNDFFGDTSQIYELEGEGFGGPARLETLFNWSAPQLNGDPTAALVHVERPKSKNTIYFTGLQRGIAISTIIVIGSLAILALSSSGCDVTIGATVKKKEKDGKEIELGGKAKFGSSPNATPKDNKPRPQTGGQ